MPKIVFIVAFPPDMLRSNANPYKFKKDFFRDLMFKDECEY